MTLAGQQKRGEKIHAPKSDRRPYAGLGRVGRAIDRTSPDLQHRPRIDAAGPAELVARLRAAVPHVEQSPRVRGRLW